MTNKQKELYNIMEKLPEELLIKVLDYIEYLKFSNAINNAPKELIVKDKNELIEKLKEGIKATENGQVCSIDEVFDKLYL